MRYALIRKMDISDGPGIRVSLFVQGCHFHCYNCFNGETHDFEGGKPYTEETKQFILDLCDKDTCAGLSLLGGEPLHPVNRDEVAQLAKAFKERYPDKDLWCWTGFLYEQVKDLEVMKYLDVLVDGQYKDELHDFRLMYRGSSNQRVIDIPKSRQENQIVLFCQ